MDKLKMAHDWYMEHGSGAKSHLSSEVETAWKYADEMQKQFELRNFQFGVSDWQPDWSKAPEWAKWWAVDKDAIANWFDGKPSTSNGYLAFGDAVQCDVAPQFNYKGNWQDSLHKRPDSK